MRRLQVGSDAGADLSAAIIEQNTARHGVPLLAQVRIFHRGSVAKGMLLADSTLPDGYIVMCASMVKVCSTTHCDRCIPKLLHRAKWQRSVPGT